ncbi:OPT oligopeptide transporter domain containing protein [Rhypophila decipiens]
MSSRSDSAPPPEELGDIPLVPIRRRDFSPSSRSHPSQVAPSEMGSTAVILNTVVERAMNASGRELDDAKTTADGMSLDELRDLLREVVKTHERDSNFPPPVLTRFKDFLKNEDANQNPDQHPELIEEIKIDLALVTNNSPYAIVRSVVQNQDDPSTPASTIRCWVIGMLFTCIMASTNQMYSIRQPSIRISTSVAQLLAYPFGKFCERFLPDWGFTFLGIRHSLNPGPFNKKEHMLITIMANVASNQPYSNNVVWIQYLEEYLNQRWAGRFLYQILLATSTNFIGYGMAGLVRRFLVYPSFCIWPTTLSTLSVNAAFHTSDDGPVRGPGGTYSMTRYKFFFLAMGASFVWYWVPGYFIERLGQLSWIAWIDSDNLNLSAITGFTGLGFNPLPTLDWNVASFIVDGLAIPVWVTINMFISTVLTALVTGGVWYRNAYFSGYIPIMSNRVYDNTGNIYRVSSVTDVDGCLIMEKYEAYSPGYISAAQLVAYFCYFAVYPATIVYVFLNHRYSMVIGVQNLYRSARNWVWRILRKSVPVEDKSLCIDVHHRLMKEYQEVPECWYLLLLVLSVAAGIAALVGWKTDTTPLALLYGIICCLIFIVPLGIIKAITGLEVTLSVLAEFVGGYFAHGDTLALNFFKTYGYVTCSHAIIFSGDLKLAHYAKIPPRQTFCAQVIATLVSTFLCTRILNFQMNDIPDVCTPDAPFEMVCPGINTFFAASVIWGTIGPKRFFAVGGQYAFILLGWLVGFIVPFIVHYARKLYPKANWLTRLNSVVLLCGGLQWAPYNLCYMWPAVPVGIASWLWVKGRWGEFWERYNYVLSAALATGIALASVVIFFALDLNGLTIEWWGTRSLTNLENGGPRFKLLGGEYFGPRVGDFH